MKADKMTNEELAHNLHATIPFLTKEARHVTDADEIMREAATRLLNQGEIAVKDAEIARLRSLVKEMSDVLSDTKNYACFGCTIRGCPGEHECRYTKKYCLLIDKSREAIGGAE